MGFANLETEAGLKQLDAFLLEKSYIEGFVPSQADVAVFEAVKKAPAGSLVNALRWYKQIASYSADEKKKFVGTKKAASEYGPAAAAAPAKAAPKAEEEDDDEDLDLFGSDDEEEDAEKAKLVAKRLEEYHAKKAAKPKVVAKSMVIFDVKPWDDETDMKALEESVLTIQMEGLVWGTRKLVPVGYGIKKLVVTAVIVDDISTDDIIDQICAFEDYVQSVDIAAFNKL